jgi:hypothetical protein
MKKLQTKKESRLSHGRLGSLEKYRMKYVATSTIPKKPLLTFL